MLSDRLTKPEVCSKIRALPGDSFGSSERSPRTKPEWSMKIKSRFDLVFSLR